MRIIAGTARSLPLKTIEGLETRPTTDKIKETLFNMLQNDVPGCYFLDLFAGSGQIGLEAISRGALYAVFIENNRKAAKCIEDNIAFTKFTKESRLLTTDSAVWRENIHLILFLWTRHTGRDLKKMCCVSFQNQVC